MGDLRQNPVTGRWVVLAPGRGGRPVDGPPSGPARDLPRSDPTCPFCPGNEHELPEILWSLPTAEAPGWRCRASRNRYPAWGPAQGRQEIVIETPRHDLQPDRMDGEELDALVGAYLTRYRAVQASDGEPRVTLFRNHGPAAGRSLTHAHAQVVGMKRTPPEITGRDDRLLDFHRRTGGCLICDLTETAGAAGRRVIESGSFTVVVPQVPESAYEMWVVPSRHVGDFGESTADEAAHLGAVLGSALRRLSGVAGDPSYNLILHSGPGRRAGPEQHWFFQIRPRVAQLAGFELATGIVINAGDPDAEAEELRGWEEGIGPTGRPRSG